MHHEIITGALVGAIKQVGIAKIKRAMPARIGIKLSFAYGIKSLGSLAVSLFLLGAEATRKIADGIAGKALKTVFVFDPDFQPGFLFENAHEDGSAKLQIFRRQSGIEPCEFWGGGQRRIPAVKGLMKSHARDPFDAIKQFLSAGNRLQHEGRPHDDHGGQKKCFCQKLHAVS